MRYKKLDTIILASFMICALSSLPDIVFGQTLDKTYLSTECGLSIKHPSNWKSEEIRDDEVGVTNFIVDIQPNSDDGFRNVVSIELDDISSLSDKSIEGIKSFEEEYISVGGLGKIETSDRTQVTGYPAQKIVYTEGLSGTAESDRFKNMKVIVVAFDREYVITYVTSNADYYDKHISTFEEMLKTFKISEPKFDGINCQTAS
jgi:hypothetical protein